MIVDGLTYPLRGDRAWIRVVVGTLLVPFSYLGVPAFAIAGYYLRVLAASARGERSPPSVDDPVRLVLDGVRAVAVATAYALPLGTAAAAVLAVGGPGWLLPTVAMAIVGGWYAVVPAALANAAVENRARAAFDARAVGRAVATPVYLLAALACTLVVVVAGATIVQLSALAPLVSLLAIPALAIYLHVVVCRTTGAAFGLALDDPDASGSAVVTESVA